MERADGKRSFYVFECVKCTDKKGICGCGKDDVKLKPSGSRMSSAGPLSAARKAGGEVCRRIKKTECTIFLREAGTHDRVRRYKIELKPFLAFEATKDTIRKQRGKDEVFARDSEELVWWNARYHKLIDINKKTGKETPKPLGLKPVKNEKTGKYEYKAPWTEEELKMRNQAYVAVGQLEANKMAKPDADKLYAISAEDVTSGKVVLCTFPGKHNVIRSVTPIAKYIEVLPIPEGTAMHIEKEGEEPKPAKPAKEPAAKKGRKAKAKAEVPAAAPVAETAAPEAPAAE